MVCRCRLFWTSTCRDYYYCRGFANSGKYIPRFAMQNSKRNFVSWNIRIGKFCIVIYLHFLNKKNGKKWYSREREREMTIPQRDTHYFTFQRREEKHVFQRSQQWALDVERAVKWKSKSVSQDHKRATVGKVNKTQPLFQEHNRWTW